MPNGRSFCIPSNEGAVGQFGPGAKALNARFESKLFVNNFVNARFKVKVACHFASFYSFVRIHCQFCERPFSLSQSCPGLCAEEPGQRPSVEARLWHGYAPARGDLSTRPFEGLLARVFNSSDGSTLMRVSKPCFTPMPPMFRGMGLAICQEILVDCLKKPVDIIMVNCKSNFHRAPAVSMLIYGALQARSLHEI